MHTIEKNPYAITQPQWDMWEKMQRYERDARSAASAIVVAQNDIVRFKACAEEYREALRILDEAGKAKSS